MSWHWLTTELKPGLTAEQLARRAGRSVEAARSAARRHGIALAPMQRGYPKSKRERALALVAAGHAKREAARRVRVSEATVRLWAREVES